MKHIEIKSMMYLALIFVYIFVRQVFFLETINLYCNIFFKFYFTKNILDFKCKYKWCKNIYIICCLFEVYKSSLYKNS